ncbi:MAG: hypothetical protein FWG89_10275 [Treponema sp.]|nr:hypothetical protein [Treponema sp.]
MMQLYFISILVNGFIGFLLIFIRTGGNYSSNKNSKFSLAAGGFRLLLGIIAAIVGVLKLFIPVESRNGHSIYILGDLLPALAGIAAGFVLIFDFYRENSSKINTDGQLDRIGDQFINHKKIIGFSLIAVSVLHFFFPAGLFL